MPDFLFFQEISRKQLQSNIIGGKAVALAQLYQNGFLVPNGFVVTTEFFDHFLEKNGILSNNNNDIIAALLVAQFLSKDMKTIYKYIDKCSPDGPVAVRSSATVEDSNEQSFAGQFETFLGVKKCDLAGSINKCWQSLYNPRVYSYAKDDNNIKMAVLIQQMIYPEVSGVAFSANPVTGDLNSIVIEAVIGSNDLLVQGIVTPDRYIVNKNLEILDKNIVEQEEIRISNDERNNLKGISISGNNQKLADDLIISVAQMVNEVEIFFNKPVDIEWAISNNKIYILQSRPITTII